MTEYQLDPHNSEDVWIEIDNGEYMKAQGFLSKAVDQSLELTEKHLCKSNAEEMYDLAVAFESLARSIRLKWEEWKLNDFQNRKIF